MRLFCNFGYTYYADLPVGGDQYESLETKKLVGQFSGLHIGPQWPRPLPYMVREALDFNISNFTLL